LVRFCYLNPAFTPDRDKSLCKFFDIDVLYICRPEVPCAGKPVGITEKLLCKKEIAGEGLKDMLPGTSGGRVSYHNWFVFRQSADTVRDKAIFGPVTATDDISCSNSAKPHMGAKPRFVKKRTTICGTNNFGCSLARAVRIMAAHGVVFAVSPDPFAIFIALV